MLIDATVVRLLLVPAVMTLLGRSAWWIPGPLDRILRTSTRREARREAEASASPADASAR